MVGGVLFQQWGLADGERDNQPFCCLFLSDAKFLYQSRLGTRPIGLGVVSGVWGQ